MTKLITVKADKSGITIRIPRTLLNFVAKNHPDEPVKILNSDAFLAEVTEQLKDGLGDAETGSTGLQDLIDEAIQEVAQFGSGCIEYKEELS